MRALCVFFMILFFAVPVVAQETGVLTGKVVDETGMTLPGANIVVKGPAIDGIRGTTADAQGAYRIEALPVVIDDPPDIGDVVLVGLDQRFVDVAFVKFGVPKQGNHPSPLFRRHQLMGRHIILHEGGEGRYRDAKADGAR